MPEPYNAFQDESLLSRVNPRLFTTFQENAKEWENRDYDPAEKHKSKVRIPFAFLVSTVNRAALERSLQEKQLIIKELFALADQCHNPEFATLCIAKILLRGSDRDAVYGIKTTTLLKSWAKALGTDRAQGLHEWLLEPTIVSQNNTAASGKSQNDSFGDPRDDDEMQTAAAAQQENNAEFITYPELEIIKYVSRKKEKELSVEDVAGFLYHLTMVYRDRQKQAIAEDVSHAEQRQQQNPHQKSIYMGDGAAEELKRLLIFLDVNEIVFLSRLLIKPLSIGVGPKTVLKAMHPDAATQYEMQHDLYALVTAIHGRGPPSLSSTASTSKDAPQQQAAASAAGAFVNTLQLNVPIACMTCNTLASPFLFQWVFSQEEKIYNNRKNTLRQYKQNVKFLVLEGNKWFVPARASGPKANSMVNIASEYVKKSTFHKHALYLRRLQATQLLNEKACENLMIYYGINVEEKNNNQGQDTVTILLKSAAPAYKLPLLFLEPEKVQERQKGVRKMKSLLQNKAAAAKKNNLAIVFEEDDDNEPEEEEDEDEDEDEEDDDDLPILRRRSKKTKTKGGKKKTGAPRQQQQQDPQPPSPPKKCIIAQTKFDGNRIQIHIDADCAVTMFTRHGKPVHHMYTDIASEIQFIFKEHKRNNPHQTITPCILDGELIIVNDKNEPQPWSNALWKYDTSFQADDSLAEEAAAAQSLEEIASAPGDENEIVVVTSKSVDDADADDDNNPRDLTLFQRKGIRKSRLFGRYEKHKTKAKKVSSETRTKIYYVCFDIVMCGGMPVWEKGYKQRLSILQQTFPAPFRNQEAKYCTIITPQHSHQVSTGKELNALLEEVLTAKGEGLVLKEPEAPYTFGRSTAVQKVKLKGPDVNTLVIGGGFCFSGNPRRFALLTAIRSDSTENAIVAYCTVETLTGDRRSRSVKEIWNSRNKLSVGKLKNAIKKARSASRQKKGNSNNNNNNSNNNNVTIKLESRDYFIDVNTGKSQQSPIVISWLRKDDEGQGSETTRVFFLHGFFPDIQFVTPPGECPFNLSIHGDFFPLTTSQLNELSHVSKRLLIPRFPVGRIEAERNTANFLHDIDTISGVAEKYNTANAIESCIQQATMRKIVQLRKHPTSFQKLSLLRGILKGALQNGNPWPQPTLSSSVSIPELDVLIEQQKVFPDDVELKPLTEEEKAAILFGITRTASQWDKVDTLKRSLHSNNSSAADPSSSPSITSSTERPPATIKGDKRNLNHRIKVAKLVQQLRGHYIRACASLYSPHVLHNHRIDEEEDDKEED